MNKELIMKHLPLAVSVLTLLLVASMWSDGQRANGGPDRGQRMEQMRGRMGSMKMGSGSSEGRGKWKQESEATEEK